MSVNLEEYRGITLEDFCEKRLFFKEEYNKIRNEQYVKLQKLREWKNWVYSLELVEYKKDRIWEYLNDDIDDTYFLKFIKSVKYGKYWEKH